MALDASLDEQNGLGRFHGAALVRRGSDTLLDRGFGCADDEFKGTRSVALPCCEVATSSVLLAKLSLGT